MNSFKVSVSEDVKNIDFQQVGHFISVTSTRKTLMLIEGAKSKELQEVVIAKGGCINKKYVYRTRAIISRGLYIFTPFFLCGL
jgi:hypothetical protein